MSEKQLNVKRFWFRSKSNGQYVEGFENHDFRFKLLFTDNRAEAVSVVTDLELSNQICVRLYQAISRRPSINSEPLSYSDLLSSYEVTKDQCDLVYVSIDDDEIARGNKNIPNTTYVVGDAQVDIDQFGAERQIAYADNRWVELSKTPQTFNVLSIGKFVDDKNGQYFPGMTVNSSEGPMFWGLSEEYLEWVDSLITHPELFPCYITFGLSDDDKLYGSIEHKDE